MKKPRIIVLRAVHTPEGRKLPKALLSLQALGASGAIEFTDELIERALLDLNLHEYDVIILRPNWGGILEDRHLADLEKRDKNRPKCLIATLSVGDSNIQLNQRRGQVDIVKANIGNIDSTAELAIWMAVTLRRRLHERLLQTSYGIWNNSTEGIQGSLQGTSWGFLGSGKLAGRVFGRAIGMGAERINVWHRKPTAEKLTDFLNYSACLVKASPISETEPGLFATTVCGNPGLVAKRTFSSDHPSVKVSMRQSLEACMLDSDLICVTLPDLKETAGLLTQSLMASLSPRTIVICVGRAEVFDPKIYSDFFPNYTFKSGGFGTDVLEKELEGLRGFSTQRGESYRVWAAYSASFFDTAQRSSAADGSIVDTDFEPKALKWPFGAFAKVGANVLLTPHLGGATPESEEQIADEVLGHVASKLGLQINLFAES